MASFPILDRPIGGILRDIRLALIAALLPLSLVFGWTHATLWLALPPVVLGLCLAAQTHAINLKIGRSAWASVGFARFTFGTNLWCCLRDCMVCAGLFLLAHMAAGALGR